MKDDFIGILNCITKSVQDWVDVPDTVHFGPLSPYVSYGKQREHERGKPKATWGALLADIDPEEAKYQSQRETLTS